MRIIALLVLVAALSPRAGASQDDAFHMTIVDAFTITDRGVVVTGVVRGGTVRVNDVVCLRPVEGETRELTVVGIEMFRREFEVANPGDAIGLLLAGIEREDIEKGDAITASCD